jgi:hypothetical protein
MAPDKEMGRPLYLDVILNQINKDYRKYFPNEKDVHTVSNEIFQKLNLIRY